MIKILDCGDVVVVRLELNVGIDGLQRLGRGRHLGEAGLVRLEEQTIHVGQLDLVWIAKKEKTNLNSEPHSFVQRLGPNISQFS